jgi:hypothetical protein
MVTMGRTRAVAAAVAVSSCVLVAACSSAQHPAAPAPVPVTSPGSSDAVPQYLTAVNALCDGLAQKITALNGGKFDIPLKDYIAFASKLDAARLRAARHGAAAYRREIDAEKKSAASDPSIAGLEAAGFSQSCTAR